MSIDNKIAGVSGGTIAGVVCTACPVHAPGLYATLGASSTAGGALSAIYNKKHDLVDFIHTNILSNELPIENPVTYTEMIKNQDLVKDYEKTELMTDIGLVALAIPTTMFMYKGAKNYLKQSNFKEKISNTYNSLVKQYK
jgi:hypothetical protein